MDSLLHDRDLRHERVKDKRRYSIVRILGKDGVKITIFKLQNISDIDSV